MATDKPRYNITVDDQLLDEIEKYRYDNRIATRSKATVELLRKGIEEILKQDMPENGMYIEGQESIIIKKYRQLDQRGQQAVSDTLEREYSYVVAKERPAGTPVLHVANTGDNSGFAVAEMTPEESERTSKAYKELKKKDKEGDL